MLVQPILLGMCEGRKIDIVILNFQLCQLYHKKVNLGETSTFPFPIAGKHL